jgi:oligoendopeptidase F
LQKHRRRINRILREAPYTLPGQAQAVVESMARWPRMAAEVRSSLTDANLGWPTVVTSTGDSLTADFSGHSRLRRLPNAGDRAAVSRAFYGRLKDFENTFGLLLTGRIEADLTIARHRKFESGIDAIWYLRDGMPLGSAETLVNVTRQNLATLQRYIRIRGKALGLESVTDADISAPPPVQLPALELADAMRLATESTKPLGSHFQDAVQYALAQPWMSLASAPEKNATYAVWPSISDAPPYFIISYQPRYAAARAFVGGATLMTAFASAMPDNTPDTRDDPGIYSNAMIYIGDMVTDDYMIANAQNRDERIAYYLAATDLLYRQYFRWALVCDLDRQLEHLIANGHIPSGARISNLFLDLSREYYGSDQGIVTIDSLYGTEWMTYAVPFLSYEHEFWPPAMAAACVVLDRIDSGDITVRDKFYRVLGRGDLDLTYSLFADMGIELASEAPYLAVLHRMNDLLDGLEATLQEAN